MDRFFGSCVAVPQGQAQMSCSALWTWQEVQRLSKLREPRNPYCCYPYPCSSSGDLLGNQSSYCHLCSRNILYTNFRAKKSHPASPHLPKRLRHTLTGTVIWQGAMTPSSDRSPDSFQMAHFSQKGQRSKEICGRREVGLQL